MRVWLLVIALVVALLVALSIMRSEPEREVEGQRIVSLSPAMTEILFELELGEQIVGVSAYSDYPPQASRLPEVGSYHDPTVERILKLKPDLVLGQRIGPDKTRLLQEQLDSHCELLILKVDSLAEIMHAAREIAEAAGCPEKGRELAHQWDQSIERLRQRYGQIPEGERIAVYVEIGANPLRTAGDGSYMSELLGLIGARNVGDAVKINLWPVVSSEAVIKWNPQVILLLGMQRSSNVRQEISSRLGWDRIEAVKNGRIIELPDAYKRQGPRLFAHAERLAEMIHHPDTTGSSE